MNHPHPMDGKLGWRLRAYTAIVGTRTIGAGAAYWLSAPRIRESPAFDIVREIAPLRTFAVVMVILGALALGGVVHPSEKGLRAVMVGSFGLAFLFGLCVALGTPSSPAVVMWFAFAATDLLVAGIPYTRANGLREADG